MSPDGAGGAAAHRLSAKDVTVRFGPVVALNGFTADIPEGVVGLLGPNGVLRASGGVPLQGDGAGLTAAAGPAGPVDSFKTSERYSGPVAGRAGRDKRGKKMHRGLRGASACAIVSLCLVLPAVLMVGGPTGRASAETVAPWTISLYIDADNNFDTYWEGLSLLYLQNIPASAGVNIVAFVDRLEYPGTELWVVEGSDAQIVETFPEMNFGDGATLQWVIEQTTLRYPSENLLVDLWDHGSAWNGFCGDDTSDDWMYLDELKAAIQGAGAYIDILACDACSMASIETAYTLSETGLVDILVASVETVAGDGFPYDFMFTPVALDPARTPNQVAGDMIAGWAQYYDPRTEYYYATLSAISIGALSQAMGTIDAWCDKVHANLGAYYRAYKTVVRDTYSVFYTKYQVDMVDLGNKLLANTKITNTELRASTQAMIAAVENAVIYLDNAGSTMMCGGLSLWWGTDWDWSSWSYVYAGLDFAVYTGWYDFLADYNG